MKKTGGPEHRFGFYLVILLKQIHSFAIFLNLSKPFASE